MADEMFVTDVVPHRVVIEIYRSNYEAVTKLAAIDVSNKSTVVNDAISYYLASRRVRRKLRHGVVTLAGQPFNPNPGRVCAFWVGWAAMLASCIAILAGVHRGMGWVSFGGAVLLVSSVAIRHRKKRPENGGE